MKHWLDIYLAYFKTSLAVQFQYRAAMLIWLIGMVLEPLIYLVVWSTVARSGGGDVGGFTPGDFAAYYIILMIVNHATLAWNMYEFEFRIQTGMFSVYLLRPVHPIHMDISSNLSFKLLSQTVLLPTAAALAFVFKPTFDFRLWTVVAFVPALALAFAVRFLFEWCLALSAFWTTRVMAVNQLYFGLVFFTAGRIAPLELLPAPLQTLAAVLPFRWMIAFPVELMLGRLTPEETLVGFAAQAAWLLVSLTLIAMLWKTACRRFSAVGA